MKEKRSMCVCGEREEAYFRVLVISSFRDKKKVKKELNVPKKTHTS